MKSPSSTVLLTSLLAFACIRLGQALDIAFGSIQCDESLPVYALPNEVRMTCNDGEENICSFGQDVLITGELQYNRLNRYTNGTGYATANLRLLSVEYSLLEEYPIDFCGNWIHNETYDGMDCPYANGEYTFSIPYTLPWDDDDITTWFATGWSGVSSLQVRNGFGGESSLLVDCTLNWHTYVTPSQAEGWKTMPSAAQTGIVLASVLTAILCCCTYMTCCRSRKKHVTDIGYYSDYGDFTNYQIYDEETPTKKDNNDKTLNNSTAEKKETTAE